MDLIDIGQRVRESRRALGLTQPELAARARTSRQTLDRLENGRTPEIGHRTLMRILHALGLDLRLTALNQGRPTLDDLARENDAEEARAREAEAGRRRGTPR